MALSISNPAAASDIVLYDRSSNCHSSQDYTAQKEPVHGLVRNKTPKRNHPVLPLAPISQFRDTSVSSRIGSKNIPPLSPQSFHIPDRLFPHFTGISNLPQWQAPPYFNYLRFSIRSSSRINANVPSRSSSIHEVLDAELIAERNDVHMILGREWMKMKAERDIQRQNVSRLREEKKQLQARRASRRTLALGTRKGPDNEDCSPQRTDGSCLALQTPTTSQASVKKRFPSRPLPYISCLAEFPERIPHSSSSTTHPRCQQRHTRSSSTRPDKSLCSIGLPDHNVLNARDLVSIARDNLRVKWGFSDEEIDSLGNALYIHPDAYSRPPTEAESRKMKKRLVRLTPDEALLGETLKARSSEHHTVFLGIKHVDVMYKQTGKNGSMVCRACMLATRDKPPVSIFPENTPTFILLEHWLNVHRKETMELVNLPGCIFDELRSRC